ncbi:MAG: hypothetical protein A2020_07670 [Lentisphaerae bacterium GWF2_45_14]|nr:MAG: hypothetical protein A2020_07670 [Lentisphaerae bacterium GWF2_45_14]
MERPHVNLLKCYFVISLLSGPFFFILFPYLFCKYHTLRYKFDEEGITVAMGLLFRREVHLTYSRIQDIHIISGVIQRWLGLSEIQIQTAAGSAAAEITIEGILEYEELRDFFYARMRGFQNALTQSPAPSAHPVSEVSSNETVPQLLAEILSEMKASREALEKINLKG